MVKPLVIRRVLSQFLRMLPFGVVLFFFHDHVFAEENHAVSVPENKTPSANVIHWGEAGDIPVPGDYDGDGKADVAIYRPSDGTWRIRGSSGISWTNSWGMAGDIPVPGDYDGDGILDKAVYRPSNTTWCIQGSGGTSWTNTLGSPGDIPVPGDYDGDGKWDIAIFKPSDGTWQIQGSIARSWKVKWGHTNDIPVPSDYDGDGKWDAAFYRPSEGAWYISIWNWTQWLIPWGVATDIPVPGDYNGDGKSNFAVWRPSNGTFYISFTGGGQQVISWGGPGDIPAPADYGGNGKMDVAVFRPFDGTWHIHIGEKKSRASDLQYGSRRWQTQDGLPNNFVNAILQTRDGYLWTGTSAGLARFDGTKFATVAAENIPELKGLTIRCLCQTRDDAVWIAAENGGVIRSKGTQMVTEAAVGNKRVRAMMEDRNGVLWIGTTTGLGRYKDGEWHWFTKADGLADDVVLALCEDGNDGLWIGTGAGLSYYKTNQLTRKMEMVTGSVRTILCDQKKDLWIGTGGDGVFHVTNGKVIHHNGSVGLPDLFVSSILKDSNNEIWVGTTGGLCRWAGDKFLAELNSEGMSYEAVLSLAEDTEGNLWVGTKEGLHQLWARPFRAYTMQQGLARNNVMSVCEDQRGILWFATWGGGLGKFKNDKAISYHSGNSPLYNVLLSVHQARDASLWIGADFDGGLFQFKNGVFTHFGKEKGIIDPAIRVIYEDRQTNLWFGTSGALYRMKNGELKRFTTADGLAGKTIRALHEDHEGNLWIGTSDGLTRYRDGKFSSFTVNDGLSANQVISIFEDGEGDLWIGADGGGLNRFKNGKWHSYTSKDGLFSDSISEILEDDRNNLWMSCISGVFRVKKGDFDDFDNGRLQTIACASYGKDDGMSSVQCNGVSKPAGWKSKDGRLWFPTARGVVVVDPNSIHENNSPPPVVIEDVIADKKSVDKGMVVQSSPLSIKPGRGELEFHYAALSYTAPEKNRFKYKLEGVDADWVDAGTRRVAYYNNIKPRAYTFRVMGCNNDGVWNQSGTSIAFVLLPHFWQTSWFMGLTILTAIGVIAGLVRYITWKRVQASLIRLEQQHALERERTRIARDMHDDIGTRLTEVVMLSSLAGRHDLPAQPNPYTTKISESAREIVDSLDSIVWATNPSNDSLDRCAAYINEYLGSFVSLGDVRWRIDLPVSLPSWPMSSEVRHHLFMVVKEAINNILKHARATEIHFRLALERKTLMIVIEDNGKGFNSTNPSSFGNGLRNMKKRLEDIGAEYRLESSVGRGTRMEIRFTFSSL